MSIGIHVNSEKLTV